MISIVCVFNNEKTLNTVLLKSLKKQTSEFELITLDNTKNRFQSAAEALNYGGAKATGDYIMFIHQDMWLFSESWLKEMEAALKTIPALGVAGIIGAVDKIAEDVGWLKWAVEDFGALQRIGSQPVKKTEEVQTLDECLLVIPGAVFKQLKFDEKTFDGWDCYGADYCLCVKQIGYKAYVIPLYSSHCNLRARYKIWEFKNLLKYQHKLYNKHKQSYESIPTWMGVVSQKALIWNYAMSILGPLYLSLFPDLFRIIKKELSGCDTVLELGCGYHSHLQVHDAKFSVGVELFDPYLQESRRKAIHGQYVRADIREVEFKPRSFDAVMAIEVLEHLTKQEGSELLEKMKVWARHKVIITTPNGYQHQDVYGANPYQEHKAGWTAKELEEKGFTVRGLCGYKKLRGEKGLKKYKPAFFWEIISNLSQKAVYFYKSQAYQLMAIRQINTFTE